MHEVDDAAYGTALRVNGQRRESISSGYLILVKSQRAEVIVEAPVACGRVGAMAGRGAMEALGWKTGGRCMVQ